MGVDLEKLGLKCGLEIHQQLATEKLFCRCPSTIREDAPDFTVTRYLRASAGETGVIDAAALQEQAKAKRFCYQGYEETTCLVELDEEPPHELNPAALTAAVQVAKLLNSSILDQLHVMRKTVVDGSNTSGFQRTGLLALGGKLHDEDVRIQTICIEEDSAKIIERRAEHDTYNLSRLGIPLIEIATEPDIATPEQAQRTAAEIGMIVRSTGVAKRGLGTIRQDLNVSIKAGARVEIKGAQDLKLLPELVRNEMLRQHGLVLLQEELTKRGVKKIPAPAPHNLSPFFTKTACAFVKKGIAKGAILLGFRVEKFAGLLGRELFPNYRLGTELAGFAKTFGFGGIIHSDEELKKYKFSTTEVAHIRKTLQMKKDDAFILLLGEEQRAHDCLAFALIPRLEQLLRGVPQEVRKANADGTSTHLRPMPGAARMYPETDIPPVTVKHQETLPPKLLKEQEADLVKEYKIPASHAKSLLRDGWDFHALAIKYKKLPPIFISTTLLDTPKELKRRHNQEIDLTLHEKTLHTLFTKISKGEMPKDAVLHVLHDLAKGKQPNFAAYGVADTGALEKVVKEVLAADPDAPLNALMGQAMAKLQGKANGKDVMELLKKLKK